MLKGQKRVLLVGPLPPKKRTKVTGVQVAFSLFVDSLLNEKNVQIKVINTAGGGRSIGNFNLRRIKQLLVPVFRTCYEIPSSELVYLVISSSWWGFLKDAILVWSASLMKKRVVIHLHGGGYQNFYDNLSPMKRYFVKKTIDQVDKIIVLGDSLREQFYFVEDVSKTNVVPNGVPEIIDRNDFNGKQIPVHGPINILFLSNLIPEKGYWDLLEACRILHQDCQLPVRCHFAGAFAQINGASTSTNRRPGNSAEKDFFETIERWKLDDVVTYHGVVTGESKNELLRRCHLFVLPTYYPWEGQPLSIIEAMACGTPIITTKHKAIPDVVIEGENGIFVQPKDPSSIVRAIKWFIFHPSKYHEFSLASFHRYQTHYKQELFLRRLKEVVISDN